MEHYISLFLFIPLLGFIFNTLTSAKDELQLSIVSYAVMGLQFLCTFIFTILWIWNGSENLNTHFFQLYSSSAFHLSLDFMFDKVTAVFLFVGSFIAFIITVFSRTYLHKERGYKRFFTTILFFYLGYNIIVISSNLTSIFIGWEVVGISSFLLIAYYRNRFLPVRNAIRIFSLYRLGDVCIILAMWFGYQLWHESVDLGMLNSFSESFIHIQEHPKMALGFSICILIASLIKSAQFPFSNWLSRAMEGPTPSSAIFYSSLAVHLGVLFLLKTYHFWIMVDYVQYLVIGSGILSFIFGTITSRIQPSIKGQIAYAIIAQVGVMMVEVALGWHNLVLIHFASHAVLRSYQLLISPSVVHYALKKQFFQFRPKKDIHSDSLWSNLRNSVYILSLHEWKLDAVNHFLTWGIFKKIGKLFQKLPNRMTKLINQGVWIISPILAVGFLFLDEKYGEWMSILLLAVAFFVVTKVFTEKENARILWRDIISLHLLIATAMLVSGLDKEYICFYVFGITVSYLIGLFSLNRLRKKGEPLGLDGYLGHCYEYPIEEFLFFISFLGLMGFPISTAFIGMETMFHGIEPHEFAQLILLSLIYMVNGLAMVRMYARIFLGPHIKTYHEQARKSS